MPWGYRAMFVLLHTYRVRHGYRTLREMISRYAPPMENHTENYIRAVAAGAQVSPDEPLDTRSGERMIPVIAAMSRVENGTPARMDEVRAGWDLFAKYPV
nr:structural protein P5 [Alistipes timonensis]